MQVVHASVVFAAFLDDGELGRWSAERLAEDSIAAPHLMLFETANVIRRTTARGKIPQAVGTAALYRLAMLRVALLPFGLLATRGWEFRENVTTYDASYVAAAELLGCRLVTLDRRLASAPGLRCTVVTPDSR